MPASIITRPLSDSRSAFDGLVAGAISFGNLKPVRRFANRPFSSHHSGSRRARRGKRLWRYTFPGALLCAILWASRILAAPDDLCDEAAYRAARLADVPADVLRAIARVETGRSVHGKLRAWPWTVNMEGKGYWFASKEAAHAFVRAEYDLGARSFDIGCFQVNHKWHGAAFVSLDAMFDPLENALYAARFLRALKSEFGTWSQAIGAYHSRRQQRAQMYLDRVEQVRADLVGVSGPLGPHDVSPSAAALGAVGPGYPLLHASDAALRLGSLVPVDDTRRYVIGFDQRQALGN